MTGLITVGVGDVHGESDKLDSLIINVERARDQLYPGANIRWVFIGDYIDRGWDSKGCIDRVINLNALALMGNHEKMLLDAYDGFYTADWMHSYGDPTCPSFGVHHVREIPGEYITWMRSLSYFYHDGIRTFVHAGIDRRIESLEKQHPETLIWIRDKFLYDSSPNGGFVVHGHTPKIGGLPDLKHNRVNLDTGAVFGGELSAAIFTDEKPEPQYFVTASGHLGKAEMKR